MLGEPAGTVAVCGATGRQGGAVARRLLASGWTVRALTRKPGGQAAAALAGEGARVVEVDLNDPATLRAAFDGADAVFSVQNGMVSGFDVEVAQGVNVADCAKAAGVRHLVYSSTGPATAPTGVPSWEAKRRVEQHIRTVGVPYTILRPTAFMELMTDRSFYPAVGTWRIWPRLTGEARLIPWLAVQDLGAVAARVVADRGTWIEREVALAADVRSLAECRALFRDAVGHEPRTFPMPIWLFDRFTRGDPTAMWRWLRTNEVPADPEETRAILPSALSVREWLASTRQQPVPA